jgi:predicted kinase
MNKPTLFILCGLPFSGKTTLSKKLVEKYGLVRADIDEIKFEKGYEGVSDDDVPDKSWREIYDVLHRRIFSNLNSGKDVICDMSNLQKKERNELRDLLKKGDFNSQVIFVKVPEKVARKRWIKNRKTKKRFDIPENIFNEAITLLEIPSEDENVTIFDYKDKLDEWIDNFKIRRKD